MRKTELVLLALFLFSSSVAAQGIRQWAPTLMQPQFSRTFYPSSMFSVHLHVSADPNTLASSGTGGNYNETSTFSVYSLEMTTADDAGLLTTLPWDIDKNYPLAMRVWYLSESADDDGGIVWIVALKEVTQLGALVATTTAGLSDDITMDTDSTTVSYGVEATKFDTLGTAALSTYSLEKLVQISVELDSDGDASADEIRFLGLELLYVSKMWRAQDDSLHVPAGNYHYTDGGITLFRKP